MVGGGWRRRVRGRFGQGLAAGVPGGFPAGGAEPADGLDHGCDGTGEVVEVDGRQLIGRMVVVLVETEAGDGLRDDAMESEGVIVGAAEELLLGVGVSDEMGSVMCEFGAEVGALESGEPEGAGGNGGIGPADHLELEVGGDGGERHGRMGEKCPVAEAAELFRAKESEDDGPAGAGAGGEDVGEGEDSGGTGRVVVGAVVDEVGLRPGEVWLADAEVIEVCGEEDRLTVRNGAEEDGNGVPGLGARGVFEVGEALLDTGREGGGEQASLDEGVIVAGGIQAERLELRGGEEGCDVLVAGSGAAAVKLVVGEKVEIGAKFSLDYGVVRSRSLAGAVQGVGWLGCGGEQGQQKQGGWG